MDAVLRSVLPLCAVSAATTDQRLLDALDPQEVQTAAGQEESPPVLAGNHRKVSPAVRALAMGAFRPVVLKTRWQEPYKPRGLRTDLWEPGAEMPPATRPRCRNRAGDHS